MRLLLRAKLSKATSSFPSLLLQGFRTSCCIEERRTQIQPIGAGSAETSTTHIEFPDFPGLARAPKQVEGLLIYTKKLLGCAINLRTFRLLEINTTLKGYKTLIRTASEMANEQFKPQGKIATLSGITSLHPISNITILP